MAIKNTKLGGTDWGSEEVVNATDLNDTFNATLLVPIGTILPYLESIKYEDTYVDASTYTTTGSNENLYHIIKTFTGANLIGAGLTEGENFLFTMQQTTKEALSLDTPDEQRDVIFYYNETSATIDGNQVELTTFFSESGGSNNNNTNLWISQYYKTEYSWSSSTNFILYGHTAFSTLGYWGLQSIRKIRCKKFIELSSLASSFLKCDGSVIVDSDSALNGETLPDLNNDNLFLRGNTTSGGTGGNLKIDVAHEQHTSQTRFELTSFAESGYINHKYDNRPQHTDVVYIMRIK